MTFGLPSWLKSRYKDLNYEVPVWYPSRDRPDWREWLVTNGLGGYSASTISDAHTRRYHGVLVSAMHSPVGRHMILSRVQEQLLFDGTDYDLTTDHWASGVVAPTGYRFIESFTTMPAPTWVYNLDGNYLIKQLLLAWGTNTVYIGYSWLPDRERSSGKAELLIRFLTGFRDVHKEVVGSTDKCYYQLVADRHSDIYLDSTPVCLRLGWTEGSYEPQSQWWWAYHWPEEAARGMPDQEDLCLVGNLSMQLNYGQELFLSASLNDNADPGDMQNAVAKTLVRQNKLLQRADLPRTTENNLLMLACDQFIVKRQHEQSMKASVIAGYPWFNDAGREALIATPGLAVSTHRFDQAKEILSLYGQLIKDGLMINRFGDNADDKKFLAADPTLWWGLALYRYYRIAKDKDFAAEQYSALIAAADHLIEGAAGSITMDPEDSLLICDSKSSELTWMDALVENFPITPRSGKPVEINALWHNLLGVIIYFSEELGKDAATFRSLFHNSKISMQKYWNDERQCLFDVIELRNRSNGKHDDSVRPNQLFAVSLPYRALTGLQEKAVLRIVENELLTPLGLRSLSPTDPSYQSRYGCGFVRADQYHRDLSYHQGTVWAWLIGAYCDALINVNGDTPETLSRIRLILQPLLNHLAEDGCIGSISEVFDGTSPHIAHGCFAHSLAVAEVSRILTRVLRS